MVLKYPLFSSWNSNLVSKASRRSCIILSMTSFLQGCHLSKTKGLGVIGMGKPGGPSFQKSMDMRVSVSKNRWTWGSLFPKIDGHVGPCFPKSMDMGVPVSQNRWTWGCLFPKIDGHGGPCTRFSMYSPG